MTTGQQTNLKLLLVRWGKASTEVLSICFNKCTKSTLCFVLQFFCGIKDLKQDARMIPGVETSTSRIEANVELVKKIVGKLCD